MGSSSWVAQNRNLCRAVPAKTRLLEWISFFFLNYVEKKYSLKEISEKAPT
jgi:hypothetical protein